MVLQHHQIEHPNDFELPRPLGRGSSINLSKNQFNLRHHRKLN